MIPEVSEWLRQAEYDYEDAEYLFLGKRYPKAIFCCHLALEKGLKALYLHYTQTQPPRTHSLYFLIQTIPGGVPERFENLMDILEDVSVKVRYPPMLDILLTDITEESAHTIIEDTGGFLTWIRELKL
ncbi:HEPN domain-containing protein [uncultured Methanospirillum sp.]|uniref:HEPN domain-containing protein n=1 Tax=uncultured Methanospirillum sp. TaxID=262503 RepID=UPI0029C6EF1A|nr:HEPN domain-containing protein [uncultured Methanospirillum sp.]